jgi:hypothetical protein
MIFCSRVIAGPTCVAPASTPRLPAGQSPPLNPCLSDQVDTFTIYTRKLDGEQEAHLIALACSPPPMEHGRWTLRLLAQRMVELQYVETLSYETVRQTLKKTRSSRI